MNSFEEKVLEAKDKISIQKITVTRTIKTEKGDFSISFDTEVSGEEAVLEKGTLLTTLIAVEVEKAALMAALSSGDIDQQEAADRLSAVRNTSAKIIQSELKRQ